MQTCIPMVGFHGFVGLAYYDRDHHLDLNWYANRGQLPRRAAQPDDDQPLWAPLFWYGFVTRPLVIAVETTADANAEWNPNYTPRRAA